MPPHPLELLSDSVVAAFGFLGDVEDRSLVAPESFKGGFIITYANGAEVRYLDNELVVRREGHELFGSQLHEGFVGNMFSPENLAASLERIATAARATHRTVG